jgi:putative transposase
MEALKRAEAGIKVPGLCRELGISSALFYRWRAKYGSMDVSMMARMKELEEENRRLREVSVTKSHLADFAPDFASQPVNVLSALSDCLAFPL